MQSNECILQPHIESRIQILRRICIRGRSYFVEKRDSIGVDLFEHMEAELNWLASDLGLKNDI